MVDGLVGFFSTIGRRLDRQRRDPSCNDVSERVANFRRIRKLSETPLGELRSIG